MILLAVSGGIDSMYMASRATELFHGDSFAVAHCNFSLRGEESDGDEQFVREWCSTHGVECYVKRFDTAGYASSHKISIEMAARNLRYSWFRDLCTEKGFSAVAVAHNANDNAETLILNLLRGTGSKGIRGMGGRDNIIRPLLDTTREEIRDWMQKNGCGWREDRTNSENEYKRNKIRNEIFPLFSEINPSFIRTLNEDMQRFSEVDDIASEYYASVKDSVMQPDSTICVTSLLELRHWEYVLWRLLEQYGFSMQTFEKLLELLRKYKEEPSGTVTLSGKTFESPGFVLKAEKKKLTITSR